MTEPTPHLSVPGTSNTPEIPYVTRAEIEQGEPADIRLHMEPGVVREWPEFQQNAGPHSVAIDGYVEGPIQRDLERGIINLNHHERVDRSSTFATCQQALFELRRGLYERLLVDGVFSADVYANDCDEDVCTTMFVLRHTEFARGVYNPALNRLVDMEGIMDITGGFYPWPIEYASLPEFLWIYEPYHAFRAAGGLGRKDPSQFVEVIDRVGERIERHLMGEGGSVELDTNYETLGQNGIVTMVRESGQHAKVGMLSDGLHAYVSVRELENGRYKYSVGRLSPYIGFDLPALFEYLNQLEGCTGSDSWGGGDTIGGSPRMSDSGIPPTQMLEIVGRFVTRIKDESA